MSIKILAEAIETALVNNQNRDTAVEGKLNALMGDVMKARADVNTSMGALMEALEGVKSYLRGEFTERGGDLVRLLEGAA